MADQRDFKFTISTDPCNPEVLWWEEMTPGKTYHVIEMEHFNRLENIILESMFIDQYGLVGDRSFDYLLEKIGKEKWEKYRDERLKK